MLSKTTVNEMLYVTPRSQTVLTESSATSPMWYDLFSKHLWDWTGLTCSTKHLYADNFSCQGSDHSAIIDNHACKHSAVALSVKTEYNLASSANNWTVTSAGTRSKMSSHTRTVVRECCKGDDESQWERGKFDSLLPKNPSTDGHQNLFR